MFSLIVIMRLIKIIYYFWIFFVVDLYARRELNPQPLEPESNALSYWATGAVIVICKDKWYYFWLFLY